MKYMLQISQLSEPTWPKIAFTAGMWVVVGVSLCVFFYYYMI